MLKFAAIDATAFPSANTGPATRATINAGSNTVTLVEGFILVGFQGNRTKTITLDYTHP